MKTFFYDKNTGKITEGIQLKNCYGSSLGLRTIYQVNVYISKPDGVKYVDELVDSILFTYKPSDKDIIECILQSVDGDMQKDVYAVVTEKYTLDIRYDD